MQTLLRLARGIDALNEWVGKLVSWLVLFMVLIGTYNAVTRKLSQSIGVDLSSNAYIELQWYMFSLVFLWGGAFALLHDEHVRVDVLYARLSSRARAWIDLLGLLLFLIPFALLSIYVAWPIVYDSWKIHEMSPDPGGLPRYPIKASLIVGFLLVLLQGVSEAIKRIAHLKGLYDLEAEHAEEPKEAAL